MSSRRGGQGTRCSLGVSACVFGFRFSFGFDFLFGFQCGSLFHIICMDGSEDCFCTTASILLGFICVRFVSPHVHTYIIAPPLITILYMQDRDKNL